MHEAIIYLSTYDYRFNILVTDFRDEKRKYKELKRDVDKMASMMKEVGSDDDEEDEEEEESEDEKKSETEEEETETETEQDTESETESESEPEVINKF